MKANFRVTSVLLLGALSALSVSAATSASRPNILYVLADQWRASATGYAGDPNVKTPNLDRLAKESLNFRNAVSVLPVCTPHRAALMTGRFPTSTGMFLNDAHLPDSELCMAEILGAAGYATAYIGKWHLDGHGRQSYIPPERRQGWNFWKAAECDHNYNHSHYFTGNSDVKRFWDGYDAFTQTKDAQQYLRDHSRSGQPFVLMIAYGAPHFPHKTAPEEFKALYPPAKIQLPPNVPPALQARARQEAQGYYAHCTALDQCIGELLGTLADLGLATNTIVVFSSDHGEALGSQGVAPTQKQVAWSESAQVPFLMRVPGIAPRTVTTPITTPDILPTLLGLANVSKPKTMEGEDLSPLVHAGRDEDRAALYMCVSPFANVPRERLSEYRAIRTSRYTYVRGLDGPWMLYDDLNDRFQTTNLVRNAECASLVRELDDRLQAQLKRNGDDFRPGKDYIAEWGYEIGSHGSVPYAATITKVQTPQRNPALKTSKPSAEKSSANDPEVFDAVEPPPSKPNFVFINIDDMGYADIESFGSKLNRTPNLNRMAAEGRRLTCFYAAPVCSPSRAALMTGCYPKRALPIPHVLFPGNAEGLNPNEVTVAELLKQQGYATGIIGKWHLGDQPEFLPLRQGFDYWYGLPYSNDMGPAADGIKSDLGKPLPKPNPKQKGQPPLPLLRNETVLRRVLPDDQQALVERYTDEAVRFLREHRAKPFFLYLAHNAVHFPIYPGKKWAGQSTNGIYSDWVEEVDWSVGRVLEALRELRLDKQTLVIFTSDNGGTQRSVNAPLRGHKDSTWEGGMREPTIAWWPGKIPAGTSSDAITGMFDILPTFVKLAGGQLPADRKLDGADIWPVLAGTPGAKPPHELFYFFRGLNLEAVRSGDWKLHLPVASINRNATAHTNFLLFNLGTDIGETHDVAAANPEKVAHLQTLAAAMKDDLGLAGFGPGVRPLGKEAEPMPILDHDGSPRPDFQMADQEGTGPASNQPDARK